MSYSTHRCILLPNDPVAVGQQLPPLPPGGKAPELKLWGLTLGFVPLSLSILLPPPARPS